MLLCQIWLSMLGSASCFKQGFIFKILFSFFHSRIIMVLVATWNYWKVDYRRHSSAFLSDEFSQYHTIEWWTHRKAWFIVDQLSYSQGGARQVRVAPCLAGAQWMVELFDLKKTSITHIWRLFLSKMLQNAWRWHSRIISLIHVNTHLLIIQTPMSDFIPFFWDVEWVRRLIDDDKSLYGSYTSVQVKEKSNGFTYIHRQVPLPDKDSCAVPEGTLVTGNVG